MYYHLDSCKLCDYDRINSISESSAMTISQNNHEHYVVHSYIFLQ